MELGDIEEGVALRGEVLPKIVGPWFTCCSCCKVDKAAATPIGLLAKAAAARAREVELILELLPLLLSLNMGVTGLGRVWEVGVGVDVMVSDCSMLRMVVLDCGDPGGGALASDDLCAISSK